MNNMTQNCRGGVFSDEATFQRIYEECLENQPEATEAIRESYSAMHSALEQYLDAVDEWTFRYAYECGYEAARKGGAVV